jgi:hypothetical protein
MIGWLVALAAGCAGVVFLTALLVRSLADRQPGTPIVCLFGLAIQFWIIGWSLIQLLALYRKGV